MLQATFAIRHADQFDFGAGQIAVGGNERKAVDGGRQDEVGDVGVGVVVIRAS